MKKLFLIAVYFMFTGAMINSQVNVIQQAAPELVSTADIELMAPDTAAANAERLRLDSTNVDDFNAGAWNILNILNGYAQFIPGVPNIILQTITGVIIGLIVRRREKKALRKKGLLNDLPPIDQESAKH